MTLRARLSAHPAAEGATAGLGGHVAMRPDGTEVKPSGDRDDEEEDEEGHDEDQMAEKKFEFEAFVTVRFLVGVDVTSRSAFSPGLARGWPPSPRSGVRAVPSASRRTTSLRRTWSCSRRWRTTALRSTA